MGACVWVSRNMKWFNEVKLNQDTGTIEWPTGADFSPAILYEWSNYKERIIAERQQRYTVSSR
jgi:hypothetical protein